MKKIRFKMTCDTGFVGATHTDEREIEIDDNATHEEIQEQIDFELREWAFERIDIWAEIIDSPSDIKE